MPTSRRRHSITETPPVEAALDELRALATPGERIDLGELVVLGAQLKASHMIKAETDEHARRALRRRFLSRRGRASGFDPDAAADVRAHGWARP